MSEHPQTFAADIVMNRLRVTQEDKLFDHMLPILREAYRQRMPEALAKAEKVRDSYLQTAVNLDRQIILMKARARRQLGRSIEGRPRASPRVLWPSWEQLNPDVLKGDEHGKHRAHEKIRNARKSASRFRNSRRTARLTTW